MKQFFVFALTGASIAILDLVDSAFGNTINIDSICVMSAFTIIYWFICVICQIGEYAYNVKLKNETECFILEMIATVLCSILIIIFRNQVSHIYNLTENQYRLFSLCLLYKGILLVPAKIQSFFYSYIEINCKNKNIVIANVLFYTTMILFDAIVVLNHGECYHLIIATGLADIVTIVYFFIFCRFKVVKPKLKILFECFKCAKDVLVDRILGKIATVTFNILASHLGTELYALHSVGYGIATSIEAITDSCYTNQIVKLSSINNIKEKYQKSKSISKQVYIPTVIISYIVAMIMVLPMHGDLSLPQTFFITILYNSQCLLIQLYENHRGFLTSCEATKCLRFGGLVGIIVRIPIAVISAVIPFGILGFALGSGIDFLIRGLYYRSESLKLIKQ